MKKLLAILVTGFLLILGVGSVAAADIPNSNTGEVTVCYNTFDRSLQVIDKEGSETCPTGYTELGLNQPAEPEVTDSTVYLNSVTEPLSPNEESQTQGKSRVLCDDSNDVALTGGFRGSVQPGANDTNLRVLVNRPFDSQLQDLYGGKDGWEANLKNVDPTGDFTSVVYVKCLDVP